MSGFPRALGPIILEALLRLHPYRRESIAGGMFAFCLLLACTGWVFFLYALYGSLSMHYSSGGAAFITGAFCLGLALSIGGLTYVYLKERQRKIAALPRDMEKMLQATLSLAEDEVGETVRKHPMATVILACAAGFFLARRGF